MFKGLLGRKIGMTQIFDEDGVAIPITVIEAGPCFVTQVRDQARDGYAAIQLGFEEVKPKRLTKGQLGHLSKTNLPPLRFLREFRTKENDVSEGDVVKVDIFEVGERVNVVGTTKGRGFAGAVKRYNFGGGPRTHGQSDRERAPGSHGAGTTPGRVWKGVKAPGHMGNERVTAENLKIVMIDVERNLIGVHGPVPGARGGLVMIKPNKKSK